MSEEVEVCEADFKDSELAKLIRQRLPEYPIMPEKIVITESREDLRKLTGGRACKGALAGDTLFVSLDSGVESIIHEIIHVNHPEWGENKVETEEERAFLKFQRQEVRDRLRRKGIVLGGLDIFRDRLIRETIETVRTHRNTRMRR